MNDLIGLSQQKVLEWGLDSKDIWILKYLRDFIKSGKMSTIIVDGKTFYWVNYKGIKEYLPFLRLNDNSALRARFKKYEDLGIVDHYVKKVKGSYSFYCLTDKFYESLCTEVKNSTHRGEKPEQNNKNLKNNKKDKEKEFNAEDIEEIWQGYPLKRGKARAVKYIKNALKVMSKEELLRAVDRYQEELRVNNTEKKYILNGSTFFHDRYLDYTDKNYEDKSAGTSYTVEFDEF